MADPGVLVRVAEGDDLDAVARLRWTWRVDRGEVPTTDLAAFTAALRAWAEDHASTHVPFVAVVDGAVVGMAWQAIVERIPGPEVWTRRSGMVQSVYVDPAVRDRGIGTELVAALVDAARAAELSYLAVHPTERAMPFYRRLGFAEYERALELRFS